MNIMWTNIQVEFFVYTGLSALDVGKDMHAVAHYGVTQSTIKWSNKRRYPLAPAKRPHKPFSLYYAFVIFIILLHINVDLGP